MASMSATAAIEPRTMPKIAFDGMYWLPGAAATGVLVAEDEVSDAVGELVGEDVLDEVVSMSSDCVEN